MSLRHQFIASVVAAGLVACGGTSFEPLAHELASGAAVRVTVAPGPYSAGASVPLIVRNLGDHHYIWNPCMRSLQVNAGLGWVVVEEPDRVCTAEAWMLEPGKSTEASTDVAAARSAGEYRFHYGFSRLDGDTYVTDAQVSNSFMVTP